MTGLQSRLASMECVCFDAVASGVMLYVMLHVLFLSRHPVSQLLMQQCQFFTASLQHVYTFQAGAGSHHVWQICIVTISPQP